MSGYVALLRGVNVGGKNALPMASLRAALGAAGLRDARTYIQSGNVVLPAPSTDAATLSRVVHDCIANDFGMEVAVIVRTRAQLADVVTNNPFTATATDPSKLHVSFLLDRPSTADRARLDPACCLPDEFAVRGREIFLHCPNGIGRSSLPPYLARQVRIPATIRSWNTVTKLLALMAP